MWLKPHFVGRPIPAALGAYQETCRYPRQKAVVQQSVTGALREAQIRFHGFGSGQGQLLNSAQDEPRGGFRSLPCLLRQHRCVGVGGGGEA